MSNGCNTTLVGNVTRDPELRFTPSGAATCSFGLAVNRRWMQGTEWQEEVSFFDVTCWKELAENVAETSAKGTRVVVTGRLEQQRWEDKNGGGERSKVHLVADDVGPSLRWASAKVTRNERQDNGGGHGSSAPPQQEPPQGYDSEESEPF